MNTRKALIVFFSALGCAASLQAQAAPPFAGNPDLYGHVLVAQPRATTDAVTEPGHGDSYGSVLLDAAAKATTDAMVERGMGDNYGSVLLDIGWSQAGYRQTASI